MTPLSLDEVRELAPGYVMGTLTAEEFGAFEVAMQQPSVASVLTPELEAHRAALEVLATERAVRPPPGLRDRVLARIASEQQRAPGRAPLHDVTPIRVSGEQATPLTVSRSTRVTPAAGIRVVPAARSSAPWWIAGAFGVALAASAVFAVNVNTRLHATQKNLAQVQLVATTSSAKLAESEATLRSLLDGGSDLVLVRLIANESPEPGMQVFWNKKKGSAVVLATGLKPVARDRAYCLWLIKDGTPVAVKLFNVDADGRAVVSGVTVPTSAEGITAFAVTEEPAAGSPQPTMTPFLVGALPKL